MAARTDRVAGRTRSAASCGAVSGETLTRMTSSTRLSIRSGCDKSHAADEGY